MRIIAGDHRGRTILGPEGDVTRPITDRVKQSVFDILSPWIESARVYDCFAGTGSMGLECLSRGANSVTFLEADRSALKRLRMNIDSLRVAGRANVVAGDLFQWFDSTPAPDEKAELIFLDPPYRYLREKPEALRSLARGMLAHLAQEGRIIFRHDAADRLDLPGLEAIDERAYGSMVVRFLGAAQSSA